MTSTNFKTEFDDKYGKKITEYLVNMMLQRTLRGDMEYLGENPSYFIGLLICANQYLWEKVEEFEKRG